MKPEQPVEVHALRSIFTNAVSAQPVLVQPDIDQQHCNETQKVEEILFHRHTAMQCWSLQAKRSRWIWKGEKEMGEAEIEQSANGKEQSDRPPEGLRRKGSPSPEAAHEGMESPIVQWTPTIAPSGIAFPSVAKCRPVPPLPRGRPGCGQGGRVGLGAGSGPGPGAGGVDAPDLRGGGHEPPQKHDREERQ